MGKKKWLHIPCISDGQFGVVCKIRRSTGGSCEGQRRPLWQINCLLSEGTDQPNDSGCGNQLLPGSQSGCAMRRFGGWVLSIGRW